MEKQFIKVDNLTLKIVEQPEAIVPEPIIEEYTYDQLVTMKKEHQRLRDQKIQECEEYISFRDIDIADIDEKLAKFDELGIEKGEQEDDAKLDVSVSDELEK